MIMYPYQSIKVTNEPSWYFKMLPQERVCMGESGRVVSDATPSVLSSQFFCKPQTVLKLDCLKFNAKKKKIHQNLKSRQNLTWHLHHREEGPCHQVWAWKAHLLIPVPQGKAGAWTRRWDLLWPASQDQGLTPQDILVFSPRHESGAYKRLSFPFLTCRMSVSHP